MNTGIDGLAASPIRVMEQLLVLGNAFNAMRDYELSDMAFAGVLSADAGFTDAPADRKRRASAWVSMNGALLSLT